MNILEFIKSLFFPRLMKRHRYMSLLIAICLFILEMYLIVAPSNYYYINHTHDLVVESDLYYLQSILNISETEEFDNLVKELQSKAIRSGSVDLINHDLKFDSIVSKDSIGVISIDKSTNTYLFNNNPTNITITNSDLTVEASDGSIIINNVDNKKISIDNIKNDTKIKLLNITQTDRGNLVINGTNYDYIITSSSPEVLVIDNNIYVDSFKTDLSINDDEKLLINLTINENVSYYKKEYVYTNENNKKIHLTFIIDLDAQTLAQSTVEYDEKIHQNILNEEYYYITIANNYISYQAHPKGIDAALKTSETKLQSAQIMVPYSNTGEFSINDLQTSDVPEYLLSKLEIGYALFASSSLELQMFIYCIVFTFVVSILFFILFRKNGRLKTLKEYYNIASIANIIPSIVCFIIMWFSPVLVGSIYLFVFAVYYLLVLYRINNSPEAI